MRTLLLLFLLPLGLSLSAQMVGDVDYGLASYYSDEYDGSQTAYGETYNKNELVAAHKLYPYNSRVRVKNVENNASVVVRVIDKGPFIRGRIIELSEAAARQLGMIGKSTAEVEITLLSTPSQPAVREEVRTPVATTPPPPAPTPAVREPEVDRTSQPADVATRRADAAPREPTARTNVNTAPPVNTAPAAPASRPTPASTVSQPSSTVRETARQEVKEISSTARLSTAPNFAPGMYKIAVMVPPVGDYGVQVGSFRDLEHAMDKITELQSKFFDNILIQKINTSPNAVYKVILGPFATERAALNYKGDLKSRYKMDGFTVRLPEN